MSAAKVNETFDDIVFEGRNKAYGAYILRTGYGRSILIATVIGISILLLLSSIPAISAWISELTEKKEEAKKDTKMELADLAAPKDLPPPPPPPPAVIEPKQVEMIKFTEPTVEEKVEDEDIAIVTPEPTNVGNENQDGENFMDVPEDNGAKQVVEEPVKVETFTIVEQMPQFPGGDDALLKYLGKNIKYPEIAKDASTQGTVYLSFVVDENGRITSPTVIRGLTGPGAKDCANEALRVVSSMPTWSAGKQNGKAVRVQYTLPVKFTLR